MLFKIPVKKDYFKMEYSMDYASFIAFGGNKWK